MAPCPNDIYIVQDVRNPDLRQGGQCARGAGVPEMRGTISRPGQRRSERGARRERGFSLLDLLVSISVMVILMAILMPAMRMAHESARRVRCLSNVHQIGLAVAMYTDDYQGALPPALFDEEPAQAGHARGATSQAAPNNATPTNEDGADTMFVRYRSPSPFSNDPLWDGLGILIGSHYLNHPGVFYCPSHHGEHPFDDYSSEWTSGGGTIAANYQYRIPAGLTRIGDIDRKITLVADGMRTLRDYNHVIGNNFLKADLSTGWFSDIDGAVANALPETPRVTNTGPSHNNPWLPMDDSN